MEQVTDYDPKAFEQYKGPKLPTLHKCVEPVLTDHLLAAIPSATAQEITVRVTERFGTVHLKNSRISY